jgi:hypothetical protein
MSFLTELDVVNEMLASLGESPLNTLDEDHPLVPAGQRLLRVASMREQAKSWWFNKELVTLTPDPGTGHITTPADAIRVDPSDPNLAYVQRGRRLYQTYASATADKFRFSRPVECWLVRNLLFDDLPPSAQILISCAAVLDFQKAYDADAQKFAQIQLEYRTALTNLNAEHIRNQNVNLLNRPSMRRTMMAIGSPMHLYR